MFTSQKRRLTALVINLSPAALEIYSFLFLYAFDEAYWRQHFLHYTDYSAFCLLISSIALSTALVLELYGRRERTPYGFRLFRFMTVSSEVLQGLAAVLLLVPFDNFANADEIFSDGANFIH